MYNNLHYMFGGSNSYIDYYFGNNYVLQQENDLLRKEIKKEKNKYNDIKNNYAIIHEYITNLENKLEFLTNDYDELKFKYEMLKNNNDIIEDFEKI